MRYFLFLLLIALVSSCGTNRIRFVKGDSLNTKESVPIESHSDAANPVSNIILIEKVDQLSDEGNSDAIGCDDRETLIGEKRTQCVVNKGDTILASLATKSKFSKPNQSATQKKDRSKKGLYITVATLSLVLIYITIVAVILHGNELVVGIFICIALLGYLTASIFGIVNPNSRFLKELFIISSVILILGFLSMFF